MAIMEKYVFAVRPRAVLPRTAVIMSPDHCATIRASLDEDLSIERFESDPRPTVDAATQFFHDLFVELLDFEAGVPEAGRNTWAELSVDRWPASARSNAARLFARAGKFRVLYVELDELSRRAEQNVVHSLTRFGSRRDWAIEGRFLVVFHAPGADTWHLVTPYQEATDDITTGRPVLRRYTLGNGQTNRRIADALQQMDGSRGRLGERIDEAFSVEPLTENFFERYRQAFEMLGDELREKGLATDNADRYAHITLYRLIFFYYLQQTGWIGGRNDFVGWFHDQYRAADDTGVFHEKWLSALFFAGTNHQDATPVEPDESDLPAAVAARISAVTEVDSGLFHPTHLDADDTFLSDESLETVIQGFLEEFNFTVTEGRPYDVDVAVDPSMLGKIYESLIAGEERDEAGIFYTPGKEVDLMCRLALYEQVCDLTTDLDSDGRRHLVEFVFSDPCDFDPEGAADATELASVLRDLRIVDPACGSGAFLVGMIQVLTELYRKLGVTPDHRLRGRIINENLYGVDLEEWAVRIAEIRLRLSLVAGDDEISDERPALPNLSCELRIGDSLIDAIGSEKLPRFDELCKDASGTVTGKIAALETLKDQFSGGRVDDRDRIDEARTDLLTTCIDSRIESLEGDGSARGRPVNGITEESMQSTGEAERRIRRLKTLREQLTSEGIEEFVWEVDFPEVMIDGGFDIVIGNPPYVRQEEIVGRGIDGDRYDELSADEIRCPESTYKTQLREFVGERFGRKPHRTSDLYLYFFFRSVDVLRDRGTLSFVTPNSWLDADYGGPLQEFLLTDATIEYVLENRSRRTFEEADVNTVISIVTKTDSGAFGRDPQFVAANEKYDEFVSVQSMQSLLGHGSERAEALSFQGEKLQVQSSDAWRSIGLSAAALWRLGGGRTGPSSDGTGDTVPRGGYRVGKWGKYIRAPTVFFELAGNPERPLSPLGDECGVNRGTRTGANQFFYLPSRYYEAHPDGESLILRSTGEWPDADYRTKLTIPREYWMHRTEDGWEPNLVLKTSRSFETPMFDLDSLELGSGLRYLLVIDDPKSELAGDVGAYVEWGESYDPGSDDFGRKTTPFPSSVSNSGVDWYDLSRELQRGDVLPMKNIDTRHVYWFPDEQTWIDDRLHGIEVPGGEIERRFVAGVLNSTYGTLSCEVNGRVNLGRGALDVAAADHGRTLLPPLDSVEKNLKADIARAFETVGQRRITSIFDELGTKNPGDVCFEQVAADRLELDRLVVRDLLGSSKETHRRVYEGTIELVSQRIEKADSV